VMEQVGCVPKEIHVFLCGPQAMVDGMTRDLRHHGVPRDQIHAEHFNFR